MQEGDQSLNKSSGHWGALRERLHTFPLSAEEFCVVEKDGFASEHPELPSFMSVPVPSASSPAGPQSYL